MAVPSRTITYNDLNSFCKQTYDKTLIAETMYKTPFRQWLWANRETRGWGTFITNPVKFSRTKSQVRLMSNTAWHPLQYDDRKIITTAQWDPYLYEASAGIKKQDQIFNGGEGQIISNIQAKYEDLEERVNYFFSGEWWTGTTAFQGIVSQVANDPTTGTWAGIDRSDATYQYCARNKFHDAVSIAGLTYKNLLHLFNECCSGQGFDAPDICFTTKEIFEQACVNFQAALTHIDGWSASSDINIKYPAIKLFGIPAPIVWDPDCPAGKLFFLNSKFVKLRTYPEADMTQTPWKELEGWAGKGKTLYLGGQLCVLAPPRCGVLFNLV